MAQTFSDFDRKMMKRCFRLAKKGRSRVHPNPMVGAVIVKNGKIVGEGYHRYFGGPHAEVEAFKNAEQDVAGATLYCNLEPCCHTNKKTPPCTPLIISKKIKRVVVSNIDPNPEVSGKGLQQLREAGIIVQSGLLAKEGEELNRFFFTAMRNKRPYVTVKMAQSLDGFIAQAKGRQTWLTQKKAVRYVHRLRSWYDAVLVGSGTILSDNPQLTVRLVKGPNPKRVVLSAGLNVPLSANVFTDALRQQTIVLTGEKAEKEKIKKLRDLGLRVCVLPVESDGALNLKHAFELLWEEFKIASLLIEGGQQVFTRVLKEGVWDEFIILQTPKILGRGVKAISKVKPMEVSLFEVKRLDPDVVLTYRKEK